MAEFRFEAIAVLILLLPGFLAARLERRLAVHRDQTDLEGIVEALLYSFVTYLAFAAITRSFPVALRVEQAGNVTSYRVETDAPRLALLAAIAVALAVAMSFATNADLLGRFFRWTRVSRRSWRDTIWSDVFHNFGGVVQVELNDGRSVMGWLKYFSDRPSDASFFLERAAWVGADLNLIPIDGPGIFLTKESGIRSVSFLNWEAERGELPVSTGNESFVRWQAATISQVGYAINLILSLATASLGFSLVLIKDRDFGPSLWGRLLRDLAVAFLMLSVCSGVACVINRLRDFRKTASIARDRGNWQREGLAREEIDLKLQERRADAERLGARTWNLLHVQIVTFGLGSIMLVVAFALVHSAKLF
jgi:hypothetical protein